MAQVEADDDPDDQRHDCHRERVERLCQNRGRRRFERHRVGSTDRCGKRVAEDDSSRARGEYEQSTHTAAALERYADHGVERHPGQHVAYVVVDDGARHESERVRLRFEEPETYDAGYYERRLVRACESVVSPLGWDRADVRAALRGAEEVSLSAFE